MYDRIVTIHAAPKLDAATQRALLVCGLWMRVGFIGASATAVGVIQLFNGEWSALTALSTVAAGVALAVFGWRRAHAALTNRRNGESATLPGTTPVAAHP